MKKIILIMLVSLGLGFGASAQVHGRGGGVHGGGRVIVVRPSIGIAGGYYPYSPYFGYGFGYDPFYPYPGMYRSYNRPSKLDLQIADIKNDYNDRIWSAKNDRTISRHERKVKVHELKHERDDAIIDAKRNYYKTDYKS